MKHVINGIEHILAYLPHKKRYEGVILTTDLQCLLIQFDDNHGFYVSHEHDHLSFNTEYLLEPSEFVQLNAYLTRYYPSHITLVTLAKATLNQPQDGEFSFIATMTNDVLHCSLESLVYEGPETFTLQKEKVHNTWQWCVHPSFVPEQLPYASGYLMATLLHLAEQGNLSSGFACSGSLDTIAQCLMQPILSPAFS